MGVSLLLLALSYSPRPLAPSAISAAWVYRAAVSLADVLEKPPEVILAPQQPSGDEMNARGKKYKLLLFNDNVNKREFVARVLVATIPEMNEASAYTVMQKAHTAGYAVCGIWVYELAEAYCEGLKVHDGRGQRQPGRDAELTARSLSLPPLCSQNEGLTAAVVEESDE